MEGNIVIGQSGGPTAVINASLAGIIEGAIESGINGKILGMVNGIEGLLQEKFIDLGAEFASEEKRIALSRTPAAYLGSCRYKLPKNSDDEIYGKVFEILKKHNIRYFLYIGGNDSMDTVYRLSEYSKKSDYDVKIVGVPKSIDNDLSGTDHCPGYGSAAKFIATAVREMSLDTEVYDLKSVLIVEIMGRNAGWLTASAALARGDSFTAPDLIYLPEIPFDTEKFLKDVSRIADEKKTVIVAVSEGIRGADGEYVCESMASGAVDNFGHKYLSGSGKVLENLVRERLGIKARAVELNVFQRAASHIASECDRKEALENGKAAFAAAQSGVSGMMVGYERVEKDGKYSVISTPSEIAGIANIEKKVPIEWINEEGNFVTEDFIRYASPLIQGEGKVEYKNGLPLYIKRK